MCGIAGFWNSKITAPKEPSEVLRAMTSELEHRGPDSSGTWLHDDERVGLGHRRLAIVDLSDAGEQPMHSKCKRYTMIYNGEIYNHQDLRREIGKTEGTYWNGGSDTETILAAFSFWGVRETILKLNGMFAFAVWDHRFRSLILVRDRMGEKPLFYGKHGDSILFGSELKAMRQHPHWQGSLNLNSVNQFVSSSVVPSPATIYQNTYKLPPGHYIELKKVDKFHTNSRSYWTPESFLNLDKDELASNEFNDKKIALEVEKRLDNAVASRLMADVPLGAFLSGGIDSSLVVALMQKHTSSNVKTFSIGFHESDFNEAIYARQVAEHLGTDHTELYVTDKDAMDIVPTLSTIWDEPFADSSQIPTHIVSRLAAKDVKVVLTGDGGDELFFGYSRYKKALHAWSKISKYNVRARSAGGAIGGAFARITNDPRLARLSGLLASRDSHVLYQKMRCQSIGTGGFVRNFPEFQEDDYLAGLKDISLEDYMTLYDMKNYLPDTILTKVDRASMAVGLETRAPMLDHRLVEYALSLGRNSKSRNGVGKWALRNTLYKYVPRKLVDRPKQGFGVPINHWLNGPMRGWAEDLLDPSLLERQNIFDSDAVANTWRQHQFRQADWQQTLWNILMFQSWFLEQHG